VAIPEVQSNSQVFCIHKAEYYTPTRRRAGLPPSHSYLLGVWDFNGSPVKFNSYFISEPPNPWPFRVANFIKIDRDTTLHLADRPVLECNMHTTAWVYPI
jgi:hypothetical protein